MFLDVLYAMMFDSQMMMVCKSTRRVCTTMMDASTHGMKFTGACLPSNMQVSSHHLLLAYKATQSCVTSSGNVTIFVDKVSRTSYDEHLVSLMPKKDPSVPITMRLAK